MAIPVSGSRISLGCLRMVIRTCLWGAIEHSPRVPSLYLSRSLRDAVRQESSFETDPFNCCSGQTSRLWSHASFELRLLRKSWFVGILVAKLR